MRLLVLSLLAAMPAAAACPPAPDIAADMDALIAAARAAPTEAAGQAANDAMWRLWTQAPDAAAQALLDEGMRRRAAYDLLGAEAALDRLVAYCPDYAEGWNQRAFVRFLTARFDLALADLDRALALDPRHVAARSGRGLTLLELGRTDEGLDEIRAAVALNPWIPERHYLPPAPPATDL